MAHLIGNKVSGEIASFETENTIPINTAKFSFLPKQEGTGTPSLENVRNISGWNGVDVYRAGKNIAHITGYSATNETQTGAASHKTTNNYGTTLSTIDFSLPDTSVVITQSEAPNSETKSDYHNGYIAVGVDNLVFGKRYNVSFRVTNITSNPLNATLNSIRMYDPKGNAQPLSEVIGDRLIFKNASYNAFIYSGSPVTWRKNWEIRNCGMSFTLSEFMVTPVEETDQTWEPYCGEKIHVDFPGVGKNLFDKNAFVRKDYFYYMATGIESAASNSGYCINYINVQPNTTYTISCQTDNSQALRDIYLYDETKTWIRRTLFSPSNILTFTTPDNCYYIRIQYLVAEIENIIDTIQIEIGSSATSYEPFQNTIYGGYVDLVNGEVVSEYEMLSDIWGNWPNASDQGDGTELRYQKFNKPVYGNSINNHYTDYCNVTHYNYNNATGLDHCYIVASSYNARIYLPTNYDNNQLIQIIGKLITPIHYPLVPLSFSTIAGKNNIWCIDGTSEIAYSGVFEDLMDYRRKILLNSPHLEETAGSNMIFKSDMNAKMKETRIDFEPVVVGSGIPGPSNIFEIFGHDSLTITQSGQSRGKNLFNLNVPMGKLTPTTSDDSTLRHFNPDEYYVATSGTNYVNTSNINSYSIGSSSLIVNSKGGYGIGFTFKLKPSMTYTLSGICDAEISNYGIGISSYDKNGTFTKLFASANFNKTFTVPADSNVMLITFRSASDAYNTDVTFSNIQLEEGSTATTYEAYQENAYHTSFKDINLITPIPTTKDDNGVSWTVNSDGTINYEGTPTAFSGVRVGRYYTTGNEIITIRIMGDRDNLRFDSCNIYNSKGIKINSVAEGYSEYILKFSNYPGANYVVINLKRTYNNVYMKGTCWVEVIRNSDVFYGGYVDVKNGEIVQEWNSYTFTGEETLYDTNNGAWVTCMMPSLGDNSVKCATPSVGYCTHYPFRSYARDSIGVMYNENTVTFDGNIYDAAGWTQYLQDQFNAGTPVKVVYKLNTPIHYQISPQTLRTLKGYNNLRVDAGEITAKYWTHCYTDIYAEVEYLTAISNASYFNTGVAGNNDNLRF